VITRQQYSEHPPCYDYMLTEAGQALVPVLRSLRRWGEKYAPSRPSRQPRGQERQADRLAEYGPGPDPR
jgi:DNA-binding HxlR family transcriptional regulator